MYCVIETVFSSSCVTAVFGPYETDTLAANKAAKLLVDDDNFKNGIQLCDYTVCAMEGNHLHPLSDEN